MDEKKPVFPFHYGNEPDQYYFYKVPKLLFHDPAFAGLSTDARLLYGILMDRMELSRSNQWYDEQGRVYIYYTIESIMQEMRCGNKKAGNILAELDDKKGIGLITRVHQGLGKPDKIFVHKLQKAAGPDMSREPLQKCQKDGSGDVDRTVAEMSFGRSNDTEISDTEKKETDLIYLHDGREDANLTKYYSYREYFKEQLDVDILLMDMPYQKDRILELVEILVEACCSNQPMIRIGKEDKPAAIVRSRFMKLTSEHIRYVLGSLQENTTDVRNIKQYLLTTLYNAPMTMGNYYTARVNHDLYGGG